MAAREHVQGGLRGQPPPPSSSLVVAFSTGLPIFTLTSPVVLLPCPCLPVPVQIAGSLHKELPPKVACELVRLGALQLPGERGQQEEDGVAVYSLPRYGHLPVS